MEFFSGARPTGDGAERGDAAGADVGDGRRRTERVVGRCDVASGTVRRELEDAGATVAVTGVVLAGDGHGGEGIVVFLLHQALLDHLAQSRVTRHASPLVEVHA